MTARASYRELSRLLAGSRRRPRIGLVGGSFNPAHNGHRAISLRALDRLRLDAVWWLVSPQNPLKKSAGMAPLATRLAYARGLARHRKIRVTDIEHALGTRYSIDTVRRLQARLPHARFVWLMGADKLAQFHRWRDWREIARTMPIAVIARPGYDASAFASPAMAWLRRYRTPAAGFANRSRWSAPALVILRFDPDHRSATAIRRADPDWSARMAATAGYDRLRDRLTHRPIPAHASRADS